jgi:hypothetical protein
MDALQPVAGPVPYKNRRGWLIAFGVVEILMGCGFLLLILLSAFAFLGPAAAKMPPNAMAAGPMSKSVLLAMVGIQYGMMAAVFFIAGIGSIRCKNWARIMMLVVSGFWLGIGLISVLVVAFLVPTIMRQQTGNIDSSVQHTIMAGLIIFMTAIMVVLPAIFLVFYSRKSVKATCQGNKGLIDTAPAAASTGLPIPLVILGVWQGMGVFSVFAALIMPVTFFFGFVVRGAGAILILLGYSVLSGYASWSIFHQRLIGWKICLFAAAFGTVSLVISFARYPDLMKFYEQMGLHSQNLQIYEQFPQLLTFMWVSIIVGLTAFMVFVLYTRRYFPPNGRE